MISAFLLVAIGGVASFVLPCTTPFAALAATAALHAGPRRALVIVTCAWAVDELAGFAFFGYPRTHESLALALLALVAAAAAVATATFTRERASAWLVFAGSAVAFEAVFAVGTFALGTSLAMFAPAIDAWVVGANAVFFTIFEAGQRVQATAAARR